VTAADRNRHRGHARPQFDHFSAMRRLPIDEVWIFQLGDTLEMLLLHPDGTSGIVHLGPDILSGDELQVVVKAGRWMGARVRPGGCWAVFAATMAPGFVSDDYEGGDAEELALAYPAHADLIRSLFRPGAPLRHPTDQAADD